MNKLEFLQGPWLWAWYCGLLIGNVWAAVTAVYVIFTGGLIVFIIFGALLWPLWVIIIAIPTTVMLGCLFTIFVVTWKSMKAMYRALPFTIKRA